MAVGFASTRGAGGAQLSLWVDGMVAPLATARSTQGAADAAVPRTMQEALADWDRWCDLAEAVATGGPDERWVPEAEAAFLPAVTAPGAIYCAGANYYDHSLEMGSARPNKDEMRPFHFVASPACLSGHRQSVRRPAGCERFDWEIELAVVIGRHARRVTADRALEVVAGYCVADDLSLRDFAGRDDVPFTPDWLRSKCFEGCLPLGPAVVPARAVADPMKLDLSLSVNGEERQRSNTNQMIFSVAEQIEYLSGIAPLAPGDVIITGTPAGTGIATGTYLHGGDVVLAEIGGLGSLRTTVVDAKPKLDAARS